MRPVAARAVVETPPLPVLASWVFAPEVVPETVPEEVVVAAGVVVDVGDAVGVADVLGVADGVGVVVPVPAVFTVIDAEAPQNVVPVNGVEPWLTNAQGCTVVFPAGVFLR
jgi:hypothetical protein